MLLLDVNICLHALYFDADDDAQSIGRWLDQALSDAERVAVTSAVLTSTVRIATNRRLYPEVLPVGQVLTFVGQLRAAPRVDVVEPGRRHWGIFTDLVLEHGLTGNDVQDAYLAAIALEHGATFVTRDRGFRRFSRLRLLDPLDPPAP